ncbi:MAG TPA: hypothetical protein VK638_38675 [Edaphobacter sp.]|nr:hypothetical protein [Edaphobacter sp.]
MLDLDITQDASVDQAVQGILDSAGHIDVRPIRFSPDQFGLATTFPWMFNCDLPQSRP